MMSSSEIRLDGIVGRDPEIKFLDSGMAVCNFSVAVDEGKRQDGKWVKTGTSWYRVVAWSDDAQAIAETVKKGDRVLVNGSLKMSSYEKDGEKHPVVDVTARAVGVVPRPPKKTMRKEEDPWQ